MKTLKKKDVNALAAFFAIHWCAVVLNPRGLQLERGTMASLGLVKKRGTLALTASGKRVSEMVKSWNAKPKKKV